MKLEDRVAPKFSLVDGEEQDTKTLSLVPAGRFIISDESYLLLPPFLDNSSLPKFRVIVS